MKLFWVLILPALIFAACTKEEVKPPVDESVKGGELPVQESWGSTIFFSDSGKTTAILYAGHLSVFEDSKETLLDEGIKVDFYNKNEVKTTTLTAKKGKVDDNTNNLYAIDSVVAVNDSGVVVRTNEMMWRNSDHKIVSDKFVTIESPDETIQGYGFESDQHLRNYVIYNITYITRSKKE